MTAQCLILAGGLATRMRPLTEKVPKALLEAGPHPFVHYQLAWLARHGVTDVVFCIGYKGEMIRDYVGDGSKWKLKVRYVDEGQDLRGTAGALRKALDEGVLENEFLVTYGDSFLPVHYGEILKSFIAQKKPVLMTVLKNFEKWDASNACYENGQVTLYDKRLKEKPPAMQYIDYGLSAFRRELIEKEFPSGIKADLADLFHRMSIRGDLAGFEVQERFYEIGSPAGLAEFQAFIATQPTL